MNQSMLQQIRRKVGYWLLGLTTLGVVWVLTPGLPVWSAPRASAGVKAVGLSLFKHEWQPYDPIASDKGDGLGPVFNARSCVECHSQGGVGGGGDNSHNVVAFEAFPTVDRPEVKGGLVHKFAVDNHFVEGHEVLKQLFPIVPHGLRIESGCQVITRDFDPVHIQHVNSTALFGAGWVDRISGKTIRHQGMRTATASIARELNSDFSGTVPGRIRILPGGRVGKFGWKAQFASLEEFVAAACANEIGLGNPRMEQAKPMVKWKYPQVERDLNDGQFRALVAFVDTLPRPVESTSGESAQREKAEHGKMLFRQIGCAACHTPDVGGVAGVYTDFMLHRLDDRDKGGYRETPPVPFPNDVPLPEEWKTPALWGVADSAPYFHDGSASTLEIAVDRHHGDAANVTATYQHLPTSDRVAIISFLKTLKAPTDAEPVPVPVVPNKGRLAMSR